MSLQLETGEALQLEDGTPFLLEQETAEPEPPVEPPPTVPAAGDPAYWRGPSWIGHRQVNWPTDGALR